MHRSVSKVLSSDVCCVRTKTQPCFSLRLNLCKRLGPENELQRCTAAKSPHLFGCTTLSRWFLSICSPHRPIFELITMTAVVKLLIREGPDPLNPTQRDNVTSVFFPTAIRTPLQMWKSGNAGETSPHSGTNCTNMSASPGSNYCPFSCLLD